jgi:nitroreductase/ketosteroid isomerase-like protein
MTYVQPVTDDVQARNTETATRFFEGDRSLDRTLLLAEDCVWWNGMGRLPGAEGQVEFVGREEIAEILLGRGGHAQLSTGETVDRYDLATSSFADVLTIADGDFVFRQHWYRATTVGGRDYQNMYGFLFRFRDDGLIDRIWEHWGTLTAWETLFHRPDVAEHPVDEVLTTTRAVRKRLDLARPVPREIVEECLALALQAPNGSNAQRWRWVLVDDPEVRRQLAGIYVAAMDDFVQRPRPETSSGDTPDYTTPDAQRMASSVYHLREHFHEVPVLVVPTIAPRTDRSSMFNQASVWASIIPAVWSFMLALRSRGLGSAWTTLHLHREQEAADLLGIPYDTQMQAGLFPVAYTLGDDFKPAPRQPVGQVARWNRYEP